MRASFVFHLIVGAVTFVWTKDCPLRLSSPYCYNDKSTDTFSGCTKPDVLAYLDSKASDYLTYYCPAELSKDPANPDLMQLVASKGTFRADYTWDDLELDYDKDITELLRQYFGTWNEYKNQMNYRENPFYWLQMPYMDDPKKDAHAQIDGSSKEAESPDSDTTLSPSELSTLKSIFFSSSKQPGLLDFAILAKHFYESFVPERGVTDPINVIVVDLREESHFLVNGLPMYLRCRHNWANKVLYGVPEQTPDDQRPQVFKHMETLKEADELGRIEHLMGCDSQVQFLNNKRDSQPSQKMLKELMTEAEQIENMNQLLPSVLSSSSLLSQFHYCRVRTPDHSSPSVEHINDFILQMRNHHALAERGGYKPWFHFHCNAGKGRSSNFLTMYDMMANAATTSFDVILARQKKINKFPKLGLIFSPSQIGYVEGEDAVEQVETNIRAKILELFYQYAKTNSPLDLSKPLKPFKLPGTFYQQFEKQMSYAKTFSDSAPATSLLALSVSFVLAVFLC